MKLSCLLDVPGFQKPLRSLSEIGVVDSSRLTGFLEGSPSRKVFEELKELAQEFFGRDCKSLSVQKFLVCLLGSKYEELSKPAMSALAHTEYRTIEKLVLNILRESPHLESRVNAAYVLSWSKLPKLDSDFREIFSDPKNSSELRSQVAEGLGYFHSYTDKRSRDYRLTGELLIEGLDDLSPSVRFWSCFALGTIGFKNALPKLKKLANSDKALVEGWWWVKWEAEDAYRKILNPSYTIDRDKVEVSKASDF